MVEKKQAEPAFDEEENEKEIKGGQKKSKTAGKKGAASPEREESSQPSTIFYLHSLLLFGGRLLHGILDLYNSIFELSPPDKAKIYRNISNHYSKRGLHHKGLNYLKEWARLDKTNPDAHYQLGIGLMASDDNKKAVKAFDYALKLSPGHKGAMYRKAGLCLKLKDFESAVKELERLIGLAPDSHRANYLLAIAFDRMDEIDKAVDAVKKAIDLDPEEIKYHQHLGFLYERQEDHTQAAKSFSRVMELQRELEEDEEDEESM